MVATSTNDLLATDTTVIEANQFPVKSVKLFSSGSAEITRTFPLSFLRSQDKPQVVEIVHLPAGLLSVGVSVTSASGNVAILDHYHTTVGQNAPAAIPASPYTYTPEPVAAPRPNYYRARVPKFPPANSAPLSQRLRELETEQLRLEDEKRLREQSSTFLITYMESLAQCKSHGQPEPAQMVSFCDDFVQTGITRSAVIAELDTKLADVFDRITEEKERLSKLSNDLPVKVVTVLSCNSQVSAKAAELTVTYVVRQVSWKPVYDLHIAMTGNTPSSTVRLDFRCKVTQWTGENWENVSLGLTTANQVSQLIQLPEPKRIDISLGPKPSVERPSDPPRRRRTQHAQDLFQSDRPETHNEYQQNYGYQQVTSSAWNDLSTAPFETIPSVRPPSTMIAHGPAPSYRAIDVAPEVTDPSQTVSQLISHGIQDSKDPITHIANGSVFIPSDHADHHVLVASLSLQAEFMRVVAPSADTRVYYMCEVKNTSEYILLPGTVKTCLNDKHVSSTDIHSTELPQILECSLAVDTGVKTTHNQAPDALPSIGAFTGKATTSYMSATVIHNTRAESIRGVIVRSSIPLPADSRITITLKEPVGLADIDEGSVSVREGCLARWSTTGGRKGKQAGLFEWVCDVNPGTEVLKAVWEVCAPYDLKLSEQVHS